MTQSFQQLAKFAFHLENYHDVSTFIPSIKHSQHANEHMKTGIAVAQAAKSQVEEKTKKKL